MQVNENRLDQLITKTKGCPVDENGKDWSFHCNGEGCINCWERFLQGSADQVPKETPAMIRMVSDQLQIDPKILK